MTDEDWIGEARSIAKDCNLQACVIISVARDGTVGVHTYGDGAIKCGVIGRWARDFAKRGLSLVPFQTVFGWGNGGVAKPLTDEQIASMSAKALAYAREIEGASDVAG